MKEPTRAPGVPEGTTLWQPSAARVAASRLTAYRDWLEAETGQRFQDYDSLWRWSVSDPGAFWRSVADHFGVRFHEPARTPLGRRTMPGAEWFPGATLNYAEHALAWEGDEPAVIAGDEAGGRRTLTRTELRREVARAAAGLRALGVRRGDRVAAFAPNVTETLVAFLATASLGATWSSCSPEFGVPSVLDRFRQVEPRVLLAVASQRHGGKTHDRRAAVRDIRQGLSTVQSVIEVPTDDGPPLPGALPWDAFLGPVEELRFDAVPFDHPLWVLYSSGTTGLPKAIVQGHGGILLEHLKALALHGDLGPSDRFFWFTTTGWMMWNYLVSGLAVGAAIVLYDGSPAHPDLGALWRFAGETRSSYFGTSAPFLLACRREAVEPAKEADLGAVKTVGSTGAPLPPEGFAWVYEHVDRDLLLASVSGGTDACTAFVLSCPWLPVRAGQIQCRGLGCAVQAYDPEGRPVVGEVGELVITEPLPSMPTGFWNDPGDERLRASYFADYPGTWRHGDWIKINADGSCVIYGRSDSTLNRGGVRMGTSEFYRVVESLPDVADSLVVDTGVRDTEGELWLFVVPSEGRELDDDLRGRIRATLRRDLSPRHVPDRILAVPRIPRTLSGKKVEVPIKKILGGADPAAAVSRDTLQDPSSLDPFVALAKPARGQG